MKYRRTTCKVDIEYLPLGKDGIPAFLPPIVSFIKQNINTVGIFRKNGQRPDILKLNEAISQHVPYIPAGTTVHDAAGFLKLWLIDLPNPLISPSIISTYCSPDILTSTVDILTHLSAVTRKCVAMIFGLIQDVIKHSDQNQMTYANLAPCFFYSFTKKYENYPEDFQFKSFFQQACSLLNQDETDFELSSNTSNVQLAKPGQRRNCRTCMTALQRKNITQVSKEILIPKLAKMENVEQINQLQ